jgi:hypothetical protein
MLQHVPDSFLLRLRKVFEASYQSGYTPQEWLHYSTVFLPKPMKEDYTLPSSFRPISLTSFLFKLMERLVYWHLLSTSLKTNPLHSNQQGFRAGYSTETALHMDINRLEKHLSPPERHSYWSLPGRSGGVRQCQPLLCDSVHGTPWFPSANGYLVFPISAQPY